MGIAFGILALGGTEPEIHLGGHLPPPPNCNVRLKKYHCNTRVKKHLSSITWQHQGIRNKSASFNPDFIRDVLHVNIGLLLHTGMQLMNEYMCTYHTKLPPSRFGCG